MHDHCANFTCGLIRPTRHCSWLLEVGLHSPKLRMRTFLCSVQHCRFSGDVSTSLCTSVRMRCLYGSFMNYDLLNNWNSEPPRHWTKILRPCGSDARRSHTHYAKRSLCTTSDTSELVEVDLQAERWGSLIKMP